MPVLVYCFSKCFFDLVSVGFPVFLNRRGLSSSHGDSSRTAGGGGRILRGGDESLGRWPQRSEREGSPVWVIQGETCCKKHEIGFKMFCKAQWMKFPEIGWKSKIAKLIEKQHQQAVKHFWQDPFEQNAVAPEETKKRLPCLVWAESKDRLLVGRGSDWWKSQVMSLKKEPNCLRDSICFTWDLDPLFWDLFNPQTWRSMRITGWALSQGTSTPPAAHARRRRRRGEPGGRCEARLRHEPPGGQAERSLNSSFVRLYFALCVVFESFLCCLFSFIFAWWINILYSCGGQCSRLEAHCSLSFFFEPFRPARVLKMNRIDRELDHFVDYATSIHCHMPWYAGRKQSCNRQ